MSLEEKDNLYVLKDEEEMDDEKNPLNYASYTYNEEEDSEETSEEDSQEGKRSQSGFLLMFRIMFNPVEGWKRLRRSKITVESLQSGCFYPLLALLALSNFADYIYSVNVELSVVITKAVVAFVSFFFGYFCILMVLTMLLPKEMGEKLNSNYGKEYFIVALSTLAMFSFVTNMLPMIWPILIFLPIWTLYLMFKGIRFFHFPERREVRFFIMASVATIGVPLLIDWILNEIMPY